MLLALLFFTQDVDLDALGHPDPELRARAAGAFRRPDALPFLLRGRRHPDPEIRARSADLLRRLSPLAWSREDDLDVLRLQLVSPAPADAAGRSLHFLLDSLSGAGHVNDVLSVAGYHGQTVILVGTLRNDDLRRIPASAPLTRSVSGYEKPEDVVFRLSEGVIWAGYRRDLGEAPALVPWLIGNLRDSVALSVLAQLLPQAMAEALHDDPRPEAVDLLAHVYALRSEEGPLDPRFVPRLAARLRDGGRTLAGPVSVLLKAHPAVMSRVLREGVESHNRWWRYLSAAITASTPGTDADPAGYAALLRDAEPEIRREAVRAVLARVPPEAWDDAALLEAVEGCLALKHPLRESRSVRLQAAAVASLVRTPEASLAVLEDCDDAAVLDAAVLAMRGSPDLLARSTAALRRLTETGDDPEPRRKLKAYFDGADDFAADRATYALGGLPAGEILGFLEERLVSEDPRLRRRALHSLRRVGSRVDRDSCLARYLRDLLRRREEVETDPNFRRQLLEVAEAPEFVPYLPHRMRRMSYTSRCRHGGTMPPQGGWRELPAPAVALPGWN